MYIAAKLSSLDRKSFIPVINNLLAIVNIRLNNMQMKVIPSSFCLESLLLDSCFDQNSWKEKTVEISTSNFL